MQDSRLLDSGGSGTGFALDTVSDMAPANAPYPSATRLDTSAEIVSRLEGLGDNGVRAAIYFRCADQTVDEKIRIAVEERRKRTLANIQDPSAFAPQYPSATPYAGPQNPWMSPHSAPRYPSVSPMANPE